MTVITTLGFAGRTEEALDYYRDKLNAKTVFLMRFRDSPDQSRTKPGMEDLIFHASFQIDGTDFMAPSPHPRTCGSAYCGSTKWSKLGQDYL